MTMKVFVIVLGVVSPVILWGNDCQQFQAFFETISEAVHIPHHRIVYRNWRTQDINNQQPSVDLYRKQLRFFRSEMQHMRSYREPKFVVYPAGGFDLATIDLLFPYTPFMVIINKGGAFLSKAAVFGNPKLAYKREVIKYRADWGWGLGLTHFGYLETKSALLGLTPLLFGRHKAFFGPYFKPLEIIAYPIEGSEEYRCHGCLRYQFGSHKIIKTLVYIQAELTGELVPHSDRFDTRIQMGASDVGPLSLSLFKAMDGLLGRGSMGQLDIHANLSTLYDYLKLNGGIMVEGRLSYRNQWELSHHHFENNGQVGVVDQRVNDDIIISYNKGIQATRVKE